MEPELTTEEFQEFFVAILEHHNRKDANGTLAAVWLEGLKTLGVGTEEYVSLCCDILSSPPADRLPSIQEFKALIRQRRGETMPKLPAGQPREVEVDFDRIRQNRISFLRGIYRGGGDSKLYRSQLKGMNGSIFAAIADTALQAAGLKAEDLQITHEEVLASLTVGGVREPARR